VARPTKYKPEYNEQARKLCLKGFIDTELADFFEVNESTINEWKNKHSAFSKSLKDGKKDHDNNSVVKSLLERATGYSHKEDRILSNPRDPKNPIIVETTKHYPPDATSMIFWLKNRLPDEWRERQDIMMTGEAQPLTISFEVKEAVKDIKVTNAKS
jgi:hypothetical protein